MGAIAAMTSEASFCCNAASLLLVDAAAFGGAAAATGTRATFGLFLEPVGRPAFFLGAGVVVAAASSGATSDSGAVADSVATGGNGSSAWLLLSWRHGDSRRRFQLSHGASEQCNLFHNWCLL